jgi:hypothetical protein
MTGFCRYSLSKQQLRRAIFSGGYLVSPHVRPYGILEQGSSDIYTQCGFKPKFLPLPINPVLVHHIPNKYVLLETAAPRFSICVLAVLSDKLGPKPRLPPLNPKPLFVQALVEVDRKLRKFERSVRLWIRSHFRL